MTALEKIRREACKWCAMGLRMSPDTLHPLMPTNNTPYHCDDARWEIMLCTAPSAEAVVEQQAERIAALEARIAAAREALSDNDPRVAQVAEKVKKEGEDESSR